MYKMAPFMKDDDSEVLRFIGQNNFALVTGIGTEYPVASQLPLEIIKENDRLFFLGHLMRNTDHHTGFLKNPKLLIVFTSPHAFIDAGWYTNPAVASTVNYMSVHAQGELVFTDEKGTYDAIKQVTNKHIEQGTPGSFENIPSDYIDQMLKAIVGFRIEVKNLQHVFKLSQNREKSDRENIIKKLLSRSNEGDAFIAGEMQKRL